MPSVERRLQQLESAFLPRQRRNVSDPAELTNVELSLELLDNCEVLSDPSLAEQRADICAKPWLVDERLSDPMECFAAHLLRTVIWGGDCDWMTGPIDGALPVLAEQYRGRFPDRVFNAAMSPPPWSPWQR
jgi:hypothetical protein